MNMSYQDRCTCRALSPLMAIRSSMNGENKMEEIQNTETQPALSKVYCIIHMNENIRALRNHTLNPEHRRHPVGTRRSC